MITFGQTKKEAGRQWFEYFCPYEERHKIQTTIAFSDISTHNHFVSFKNHRLFKDTAPMVILKRGEDSQLLAGLLNSSAALFWLKQVCFNKGAGEDEARDRFEFAGGKVQQLPIPEAIAEAVRGSRGESADRLQALSQACWERGRQLPALAMKKLFEKAGEAYHGWNSALPGYTAPDSRLGRPFQTAEERKS